MDLPQAQALFEVSWEVCNKVGGIYTVVRSKVPFIKQHYEKYFLIGPKLDRQPEFDPRPTPDNWQVIFDRLERRGVKCEYGAWLVPGEPITILVDSKGLVDKRNELKFWLWDRYKIDSMRAAWEFEEPMCFATAAGMLIEEYAKDNPLRIVAQCHEWIAGFALLHLKSAGAKVGTVFTTHATMLGRTIAGNGNALYDIIDKITPIEWAYKYNVQDKHLTEVACAHVCDVFTTVSEITGMEAEKLLGRKPDVLLYNGFYIERFPTFEETSIRHYQSREMLRELIAYHFFPYYVFDLDKTIIFFTSGRYEFQNKGIDVLIEALARLNEQLKEEKADFTIIMFFWVIMGRNSVRTDVQENRNYYQRLKSSVEWQSKPLLQKIVLDFLSGHQPGSDDVFTSKFVRSLHEDVPHLRRYGTPPLTTHNIPNEDNDPIIATCRARGLDNQSDDKVKLILYPGYLDGTDTLLDTAYYDATVGAHLGVFPSSYEPWGYTPLESAVLGVPAVTTDLAGFGRFINAAELSSDKSKGIFVLGRHHKSRDEAIAQLASYLHTFAHFDHNERVNQGFVAKSLAGLCDWKHFIKHYIVAHNMAIEPR